MSWLVPVLVAFWLVAAVAAVALCAYARRIDEEIAQEELAPVVDIGPTA